MFNQGDPSNSFYVIKEGTVTVLEKNIDMTAGCSFGENSILADNLTRSNSIVAKTKCVLISISRETIKNTLRGDVKSVVRKNYFEKLLKSSSISYMFPNM